MSSFEDDEPRPSRRKAWAWGWAGVGVLVVITGWFGWQSAQQPVRWKNVGFSIDSATEATATFDVYLYKDMDAICYLRALNSRFTEVGVSQVRVALADGREQRLSEPLATTETATTAVVNYCIGAP